MTRRFMMDVTQRLVVGRRFWDGGTPMVQISTDGFQPYPEAVDLAFGSNVRWERASLRRFMWHDEFAGCELRPTAKSPLAGPYCRVELHQDVFAELTAWFDAVVAATIEADDPPDPGQAAGRVEGN